MKEFEELVKKMRKAQKDYFRFRTSSELRLAKKLEAQVDDYLKQIDEGGNAQLNINFEERLQTF